MRRSSMIAQAIAVAVTIAMGIALAGCGSSSKGTASPAPKSDKTDSTAAPADSTGSSDVCKLLTDDEVTGVIGAHAKGAAGLLQGGEYGEDSCVWQSTDTSGSSVDSVEAAELSGAIADDARQEAARETAVASFGHGAHFNVSYSRLWFECGKGDFCQVRVDTGSTTTHSGDTREDAAIKLGRQVLTRA
jgi:hypothetical protein